MRGIDFEDNQQNLITRDVKTFAHNCINKCPPRLPPPLAKGQPRPLRKKCLTFLSVHSSHEYDATMRTNGTAKHSTKQHTLQERFLGSLLCQSGPQDVPTPSSSQFPQPKSGGVFQRRDHSQDATTPAAACFSWNMMVPSGLQTTNRRSTAIRATVHRAVIPAHTQQENYVGASGQVPIKGLCQGPLYNLALTSPQNRDTS